MNRLAAEAAEAWHALLRRDEGRARDQAAWLAEAFARRGVTFDGQPMRTFLRPHLVAREDWRRLRTAGVRLLELGARVARQAFAGDVQRLCDWLGTPAAEARWVRHDPGPPDVLWSRLDAFVTPAGPRFVEINSDAPAGFGYGDRMSEVFAQLAPFHQLALAHGLGYQPSAPGLVAAVLASVPAPRPARPRVAIVDWAEVRTRPDQEILRQEFERHGAEALLLDPRELGLLGERLHCPAGPVDVVFRRLVLSEAVGREDDARVLLQAYERGWVPVVNSFRCRLSEDKAFFALLTDEAFAPLMSAEERAFVEAVVPWTRRLEERRTLFRGREVDLLPWAARERENLVLKPSHAYGGQSVFVGWETPLAEWERALGAALGAAWVLQERVEIPEEAFPVLDGQGLRFEPFKVNVNPFYVAGHEVGAVTRGSRSAVINVSAGGGSVPTFVVG